MTGWKRRGSQDSPLPSFVAYIGIGSNVGDRRYFCNGAVLNLSSEETTVTKVSSLYETTAVDYRDQADFYNAVVEITTRHSPLELLKQCQAIEQQFGKNVTRPKGPRTLDLDILFYQDQRLCLPGLTIPHPSALERGFVLVPMAEIAPDFVSPADQENPHPMKSLSETLRNGQAVWKVCGPEWVHTTHVPRSSDKVSHVGKISSAF